MKSSILKRFILFLSPCVTYAAILAPIYAMFAEMIYVLNSPDTALSIENYYFIAMSLSAFILVLNLAERFLRPLWVYPVFAAALVVVYHLLFSCFIFSVFTSVCAIIKIAGMIKKQDVFLNNMYKGLCLPFLIYFILSAFMDKPFIQFVSIVSFSIVLILTFACLGITRVTKYVEINKGMSNMPGNKIVNSISNVILVLTLLFLVVVVPMIFNDYSYISINLESAEIIEVEEDSIMTEYLDKNYVVSSESVEDSGGFEFHDPYLFWTVLQNLSFIAIGIGLVIFVVIKIRKFILSLGGTVREIDDVIEDTIKTDVDYFDGDEKKVKAEKLKFFDMSPNVIIRKKYKSTIKSRFKDEVEKWKSPSEIESTAKIENEKLHTIYEKARYSKDGCTKSDTVF
ncbi:MAG: hypothetical protein R3Y33_05265 [Clostridia bacterium]